MTVPEARIRVRVRPQAAEHALVELRAGVLQVRVAAPAREGKANAALVALLAQELGLPKGDVTIVQGQRAKEKTIALNGITQEQVLERVHMALSSPPPKL